jgi:peptidoglycan hydrolase-like protein with peptidoglycan-binding domain
MQPTPERYKEIQEALAKRGYLKEEPSGKWDEASVDALRHFQQDQNLEPDGKIGSLSLIALGLGPKYNDPPAEKPPAASQP